MTLELLLPAAVAALAGVLSTGAHRRLPPSLAAKLLTVTMAGSLLAIAPALVALSFSYVTHLPWLDGSMAWCRKAFGFHHQIPGWLGVPATVALIVGVVRVERVRRLWRSFNCSHSHGVEIAASDEMFAYTMPGAGGQIVLSSALVERLDQPELAVVLAHEAAHARHRHDRFVVFAAAIVAAIPLLMPLQRRLRYALERWADESTVVELQVDRHVVARTLATVALSGAAVPSGAVGIVGLGVPGRVVALLEPPQHGRSPLAVSASVAGIAAVLVAAAVQAHHVLPLLSSLCPG